MGELEQRLRTEFDAGPGTFLGGVMAGEWSHRCFVAVLRDMLAACERVGEAETIDRRLAAGFWFLDTWLANQVTQAPFTKQHTKQYYEDALEKVSFAAQWFFEDQCPFEDPAALRNEMEEFDAGG